MEDSIISFFDQNIPSLKPHTFHNYSWSSLVNGVELSNMDKHHMILHVLYLNLKIKEIVLENSSNKEKFNQKKLTKKKETRRSLVNVTKRSSSASFCFSSVKFPDLNLLLHYQHFLFRSILHMNKRTT